MVHIVYTTGTIHTGIVWDDASHPSVNNLVCCTVGISIIMVAGYGLHYWEFVSWTGLVEDSREILPSTSTAGRCCEYGGVVRVNTVE